MMSPRVRVQLIVFLVLTLLGASFVGARYANLTPGVLSPDYTVTVRMPEGGGLFVGAVATYRGVTVGEVESLRLTAQGVDARVRIDDAKDRIPADSEVVVAPRSAIGEQYLEFQPQTRTGPYLVDGSEVASDRVTVPISTQTLLTNVASLVGSLDSTDVSTVIRELGLAFDGRGQDLRTLLKSSVRVIESADDSFEATSDLITGSQGVLQTQIDGNDSIQSYSRDLAALAATLRSSDADLRTVIDTAGPAAATLRGVIDENSDALARLIRTARVTGDVARLRLPGIKGLLMVAPYGVESAFSIVAKDPDTGHYTARFSLVLQADPELCTAGYVRPVRTPFQLGSAQVRQVACSTADLVPRSGARRTTGSGTAGTASALVRGTPGQVVAAYNASTGEVSPAGGASLGSTSAPSAGSAAGSTSIDSASSQVTTGSSGMGKESWRWLMLSAAATR